MSGVSVRPPKQKRSQESLARVLAAARMLLQDKGFDGFTIQDVSRRAEVSVGAIYARFGSKERLLRAVHSQTMESLQPAHDAVGAIAGDRADEVVVAAVRAVADIFRSNEKLLRAFMHLAAVDDEISSRAAVANRHLATQFATAVLGHRDALVQPIPDAAVDVAFRMTFATFARRVDKGPSFEGDRALQWDELAHEVGTACAAYLVGANAARPAPSYV